MNTAQRHVFTHRVIDEYSIPMGSIWVFSNRRSGQPQVFVYAHRGPDGEGQRLEYFVNTDWRGSAILQSIPIHNLVEAGNGPGFWRLVDEGLLKCIYDPAK
jgi:hypothetical protein